MQVLITGGAGFIGSHVVEYHLSKGDTVYVIDDLSTGSMKNLEIFLPNQKLIIFESDIASFNDLGALIAKSDRIYHLAAVVGVYRVIAEPLKVLDTNVSGTEKLLKAIISSKNKPPLFLASSSEVYGPSEKDVFAEEDNVIIEPSAQNRWNYPISKLIDEAYALSYAKEFGLKVVIARLFNMIGPRQTGRYGMVVPRFVQQALKGEAITVYGTGEQTRSFCDVRDAVVAFDQLMNNEKCIGQIINVGNDHEISINQLANLVADKVNKNSKIEHISYEEAYGEVYKDIQRRRPDLQKIKSFIPLKFNWSLDKSIENLIEIYG